jgi:hypothetical protein
MARRLLTKTQVSLGGAADEQLALMMGACLEVGEQWVLDCVERKTRLHAIKPPEALATIPAGVRCCARRIAAAAAAV